MGRKVSYKEAMSFMEFCCEKLSFSKKNLLVRYRNKEFASKRAVISILLSKAEYFGLGIFNTHLLIERDWSTVRYHIRRFDAYKDICDDIWAIWNGEKSEREKFFDFEQPPLDKQYFYS